MCSDLGGSLGEPWAWPALDDESRTLMDESMHALLDRQAVVDAEPRRPGRVYAAVLNPSQSKQLFNGVVTLYGFDLVVGRDHTRDVVPAGYTARHTRHLPTRCASWPSREDNPDGSFDRERSFDCCDRVSIADLASRANTHRFDQAELQLEAFSCHGQIAADGQRHDDVEAHLTAIRRQPLQFRHERGTSKGFVAHNDVWWPDAVAPLQHRSEPSQIESLES